VPYRVTGSVVTYLQHEGDQGDLDQTGDGDASDLVLRVFNASATEADQVESELATVSTGVCTSTGDACSSPDDCGGGICHTPPGVCLVDLQTPCDANRDEEGDCPPGTTCCPLGEYCRMPEGLASTCHQDAGGSCATDADCPGSAYCDEAEQDVQRLAAPFDSDRVGAALQPGHQLLPSLGTCREDTGAACDPDPTLGQSTGCAGGLSCVRSPGDPLVGTCRRDHGPCAADSDCPVGTCALLLTTASAADQDGDTLADPIDNCPQVPNSAQDDVDGDEVGDLCDLQICGNGVREGDPAGSGEEECDDGNRTPGDGCDDQCQLEAPDCADGFDNDGDGLVDYGVWPGSDPGCASTQANARENPQCSDGFDNDFDGQVDYPADAKCRSRSDNDELRNPACGLGYELALALALLSRLEARRRKKGGHGGRAF
jgi:cysteine-rich repeat protein